MRRTTLGVSGLRVRIPPAEFDMLSAHDMQLFYFCGRSCHDVDTSMSNLGVHVLGEVDLDFSQRRLLANGLNFVAVPSQASLPRQKQDLLHSVGALKRSLLLRSFFADSPSSQSQFRVPNPEWLPPERNMILESVFHRLDTAVAQRVEDACNNLRGRYTRLNLSRQDLQALSTLRNLDIVIRPADKNLGVTVMSRTWYDAEVARQMTTDAYAPAHRVDINYVINLVRHKLLNLIREPIPAAGAHHGTPAGRFFGLAKAIDPGLPRYLLQHSSMTCRQPPKLPRFYLIPKLHKTPPKGRPIVASLQWITTPASKALDKLLQPVVQHVADRVLQDTTQLIHILESTPFPPNVILFTADVESLYTSIPLDDCRAAIRHWLERTVARGATHHLPWWKPDFDANRVTDFLEALVELVLKYNYFTTGHAPDGTPRQYRQRVGMAMGTQFAPTGANLYMAWVEDTKYNIPFHQQQGKLLGWYRYIDDIIGFWNGSVEDLQAFFQTLPTTYGRIRLTHEVSRNSIDFLDLHIHKGTRFATHGIFDLSVHRKRLNRYLYLPWSSAHPKAMKAAFLKAELIRFIRNSSSHYAYLRDLALFARALRARGYPPHFIRATFATVTYSERPKRLQSNNKSQVRDRAPFIFVHTHTPLSRATGGRDILTLTLDLLLEAATDVPELLDELQLRSRRWVQAKKLPARLGQLLRKSWPANFTD